MKNTFLALSILAASAAHSQENLPACDVDQDLAVKCTVTIPGTPGIATIEMHPVDPDSPFANPIAVYADGLGTIMDHPVAEINDPIAQLNNAGVTVIYFDVTDDAGTIQTQSALFQKALQDINTYRAAITEVGDTPFTSELAVIGHSAGGVYARHALATLENDGVDHKVALFAPYDSPMRGANLPVNLQAFIRNANEFFTNINDVFNPIEFVIGPLHGEIQLVNNDIRNQARAVLDLINDAFRVHINSPIAKQLVSQHISGQGPHNALMTELDTLGYPEEAQLIAIGNGTLSGATNPEFLTNAGGRVMQYHGRNVFPFLFDPDASFDGRFDLWPSNPGTRVSSIKLDWATDQFPLSVLGGITKEYVMPSDWTNYDHVAGSVAVGVGPILHATVIEALPHFDNDLVAYAAGVDVTSPQSNPTPLAPFTLIPSFSAYDAPFESSPNTPITVNDTPFEKLYSLAPPSPIFGIAPSLPHGLVALPTGFINDVTEKTKLRFLLTGEEKLVLWLNSETTTDDDIKDVIDDIRNAEGDRIIRSNRDRSFLAFLIEDYRDISGYSSASDLYNVENEEEEFAIEDGDEYDRLVSAPSEEGELTPGPIIIDAFIAYGKTLDFSEFTSTECIALDESVNADISAICEKIEE